MILLLAAGLALADDPSAVVEGSVVRGTAVLAVPPQTIIAQLSDPSWAGEVSGSNTQARVVSVLGPCQHVAYVSPNAILEARYELKRCPTADGWDDTLITSNAFSAYHATWRAVPEGEGARVTYEVDLSTSLWVPDSLVRGETRRSVLKMMRAMATWSQTAR